MHGESNRAPTTSCPRVQSSDSTHCAHAAPASHPLSITDAPVATPPLDCQHHSPSPASRTSTTPHQTIPPRDNSNHTGFPPPTATTPRTPQPAPPPLATIPATNQLPPLQTRAPPTAPPNVPCHTPDPLPGTDSSTTVPRTAGQTPATSTRRDARPLRAEYVSPAQTPITNG